MKKKALRIAAVLALVICAFLWLERETRLYVLMYHSVVPDGTECGEWSVTESTFREHMNWLTEQGYTSLLPSQLVSGEKLPDRPVLITFDDGYADNFTHALPVLQETGHKATVSVITGYVDVRPEFMSWEMCRRISATGVVELGCHTHALHEYPGTGRLEGESREAYEARVIPDLERSAALMEKQLGYRPLVMAYPHGVVDEWLEEYVNGRFPITLISVGRVNHTPTGLHNLRRCNLNEQWHPSDFLAK